MVGGSSRLCGELPSSEGDRLGEGGADEDDAPPAMFSVETGGVETASITHTERDKRNRREIREEKR